MSENKHNVLAPVSNEALEKVIQDLKEGNSPQKQHDLAEDLKKARLLSPCSFDVVKDKDGKVKVRPDQIKFFLLNTNDKKTFFPVFTNFEMTKKIELSKDSPKVIVRTIQDLGAMLNGNKQAQGLIINPGADNIVIPQNLVLLLAGLIEKPQDPAQPKPQVQVTYSEPKIYPTKMVADVYDACEKVDSIQKVWLKQKTAGMEISFIFFVEAEPQDKSVGDVILQACEGKTKGLKVDVAWATDIVKEKIIKDSVPLYDKELSF